MVTTLLVSKEQTVGTITNSACSSNLCGSYEYSISSSIKSSATAGLSNTDLTIDNNGLIKLNPTNSLTVGTHEVTVTVKLPSPYTASITLKKFTVTIGACAPKVTVVQASDSLALQE